MNGWERRGLHGLVTVVSLSGAVYFWLKYGLEPVDPFAVINHPWQPVLLDLHLLSAPILLVWLGAVWRNHVTQKLRKGVTPNRRSGWLIVFTVPPMVLSGYLLQVLTDPLARQIMVAVHVGTGGLFALAYLAHGLVSLRLRRAETRTTDPVGSLAFPHRL